MLGNDLNLLYHACIRCLSSFLVAGTPDEYPCVIAFQRNFKRGACLAIGWSSGRLQYFPIIYSDLANSESVKKNVYYN